MENKIEVPIFGGFHLLSQANVGHHDKPVPRDFLAQVIRCGLPLFYPSGYTMQGTQTDLYGVSW